MPRLRHDKPHLQLVRGATFYKWECQYRGLTTHSPTYPYAYLRMFLVVQSRRLAEGLLPDPRLPPCRPRETACNKV